MMKLMGFLICVTLPGSYTYEDVGYFWHVTDFHYDWTYSTDSLSCNKNVSRLGKFGDYMCDSPWSLIYESVGAMKKIKADVDFIIWTGDSAPHITESKMTFDDVTRVICNISDLLRDTFPSKSIYASFGNNDMYPHNQVPVAQFSERLFKQIADKWKPWINDPRQLSNFEKGGFFTTKTAYGLRIVSMNSVLYISGNKVTMDVDDPLGQFKWLEEVLRQAKLKQEKVMIIGHICPGILAPRNVLRTHAHHNKQLVDILLKYSDVILAMHCGHAHEDVFKVLTDRNGKPKVSMFIAPSVTPHRYNRPTTMGPAHNPGIRLVKYSRTSNVLLDFTQFFASLPDSNAQLRTNWTAEYSMAQAYAIPDLSAASIYSVTEKMKNIKNGLLRDYIKRMTSSVRADMLNPCDDSCKKSIVCGFTNFELDLFNDCLKSNNSARESDPFIPLFLIVSVVLGSIK